MERPEYSTVPAVIEHINFGNGVAIADVDISQIITEDDTPVDSWAAEKHRRLLTSILYSSWRGPGAGMPFLAASNVGVFSSPCKLPQVPDIWVSVGVELVEDLWDPRNRSYFIWVFGKPPDVVIEIVSNLHGEEASTKLLAYAEMGVPYYVIYDPCNQLEGGVLRVYHLHGGAYVLANDTWMPGIELGLTLWRGVYEFREDTWLRWQDGEGRLLLTGTEREEQQKRRAEREAARAQLEAARAAEQQERAEREARWAKREAARAAEQQERAEREAARAVEQRERAEREAVRAAEQRERAEREAARAEREAARAAEQQERAERLRSLGIDVDDTKFG